METITKKTLPKEESTTVDEMVQQAAQAFAEYKKTAAEKKADFLDSIAGEIEAARPELVSIANAETNLPPARLNNELTRTTTQLQKFAALIREGSWVEASIDTGDDNLTPPRPDIRKMLVPIGPVVVFGASNFPFAFSTAGGDTASALASGSTVIVKGHSAHAKTSQSVLEAIQRAIEKNGVPQHTVQHVLGSGNTVGKALVMHPQTKGVGFTGSFAGGKALVDYSNQRDVPIPVFAEMSSINPVVFLPDTLAKNTAVLAKDYAASITLGVGQFCTNPGILLGLKSTTFDQFLSALGEAIQQVAPQKMLHDGICSSFTKGVEEMLQQEGLQVVGKSQTAVGTLEAAPLVASVSAEHFLTNPHFTEEVFGPFSLAIVCSDRAQLVQVLKAFKGQLTTTIMGTESDVEEYSDVIDAQMELAGRIILNNVPTGVEVCASMVHGGPYPATTDSRFTSVGMTAIKRWVRPLCFQNFTESMLPDELKNNNPRGILRLVNNAYTRERIQ